MPLLTNFSFLDTVNFTEWDRIIPDHHNVIVYHTFASQGFMIHSVSLGNPWLAKIALSKADKVMFYAFFEFNRIVSFKT